MDFEDSLKKLEELVHDLENKDIKLEEGIDAALDAKLKVVKVDE